MDRVLILQMAVDALQMPGLIWVCPGRPGRPGLAGFLDLPVFFLTRTGPATRSTGSRVDPPGRSGFNNYALGSCVRTQYSWVLQQDLVILGPASGPNFLGFFVKTKAIES